MSSFLKNDVVPILHDYILHENIELQDFFATH